MKSRIVEINPRTELDRLKKLNWIRTTQPRTYDRLMSALAQMVDALGEPQPAKKATRAMRLITELQRSAINSAKSKRKPARRAPKAVSSGARS